MIRTIFDTTFYDVRARLVAYLNNRVGIPSWVQLRDLIQFKTCLVDLGTYKSKMNNIEHILTTSIINVKKILPFS